ncbi:MAG: sugar transferase [Clostridium sp.]|nr:sugar transferase [Clostridium sp.]MCM1547272.1 sugar transferase [Ruminococcus sp.]
MKTNVVVNNYERNSQIIYINSFRAENKPIYDFFKRAFDIAASLMAIVVLSPVIFIFAAAIFLQDFHNPFFVQTRMTKDGRTFKMLKLRSMCVDAEAKLEALKSQNEVDGPAFKMENDPRVTKIGRFIRKTSIDELPQIFNIFAGSMSVVGPRPPIPSEVEEYTPYQMQRLSVKSGLTCYWQCSGRSNVGFDEWIDMDLRYIKERTFFTDIKIIFKTFISVLKREGAK